ncbi:MAG TPA: helix-turn-helix transcriptional regulator [Candidatus Dormibacteraeota bacterium]|jgi:DNA-binding PadR family transcriptional regulator|nr:helix-turn-helix transcriptional regulator [Candidatus Dormibacteraeota bacterium]
MASTSMRKPSYYTLAALLNGPLHGYGIIQRAAELSNGHVRITAGTLYAALDRLSGLGWIEAGCEEIVDGRLRRYYRLSGAGREALFAEADWPRHTASVVRRRVHAIGSRS